MFDGDGSSAKSKMARSKAEATVPPAAAPSTPSETTAFHTRILRLALAVEESRAYWEHLDSSAPAKDGAAQDRATLAFEGRWFGGKSLERIRYLLSSFGPRYDAFPNALPVLRQWVPMDLPTRQVICHWHLQLSDPLYRRFTGDYLVQRRALPEPKVDRDAVFRWVKAEFPERWADSTCFQFASKLLSAAQDAGLVSKRDPRALLLPRITDRALAYLLYLLRETRFEGSLTSNPYLISVGLNEEILGARARSLPGLTLHRMMGVEDFEWAYPDLAAWAQEVVA